MKILFTGGGSGGHFYPLIAVAEEIQKQVLARNIIAPKLYYMAPEPYDERLLFENGITFISNPAGKLRRYPSFRNVIDLFKTGWGIVQSLIALYVIYPDVVFSKGGYVSFPVVVAARLLSIPIVIHESDAIPGRANLLAGKFARRIAISYPEAAAYFKGKDVALIGNPIRADVALPANEGAFEYLKLSPEIPTILVLGGSQGAAAINEVVLRALPELLNHVQIIHQTGAAHEEEVSSNARIILEKSEYQNRYVCFGYLNELALRMSVGAATLIVSRAGSGSIFEIAQWSKPAILIPIPDAVSRDQKKNAFSYARAGGALVIEEHNLTPHVFVAEITRLLADTSKQEQMMGAAKAFAKPDAAQKMASGILDIALEHEK